MVEHARRTLGDRATVLRADLTELELDEPVDVVVSNAALHWVLDQERLFARLHAALRPGGALLASYGGTGNLDGFLAIAASVASEPQFAPHLEGYEHGWRFRGAAETEAVLLAAGFSDVSAALDPIEERPADPAGYARTAPLLCYLEALPPELHDDYVDRVIARCGEPMTIDHVRLTIEARRPEG
jgi:trans-aconitate 2-methyltransferase